MKRMKKRYVAGTAFALGAAASLAGCCVPLPQPGVYGPAPTREVETSQKIEEENPTTAEILTSEAFNETEEIPEAVYGPPEYFEPDFEPETEILEDVYGPPAFFDEEN